MRRRDFLKAATLGAGGLSLSCTAFGGPAFNLYTSEYPTWVTFLYAKMAGLLPDLVKKHGVGVHVNMLSYDACMQTYSDNGGAVAITNTDCLGPAMNRPSTAILPTSTSDSADACVVLGVKSIQELRDGKTPVYGPEKCVSQYVFDRCLEVKGFYPKDFTYSHKDPDVASQGVQAGEIRAAMLWNPYKIHTLRKRSDASVLFDSSMIPGEVVDMVIADNKTLEDPAGQEFARLVCDTFYTVMSRVKDPTTAGPTLQGLGDAFLKISEQDMKTCLVQTKAYDTPDTGVRIFESQFFAQTMGRIVDWARNRQMVKRGQSPTLAYAAGSDARLTFDGKYMKSLV